MAQVRFQPRIGQLLAAAVDNIVSVFDVDTDRQTLSLQVFFMCVHCSVCVRGSKGWSRKAALVIVTYELVITSHFVVFIIQLVYISPQGHLKDVNSICWDTNGEFLASVSQDCVRVWSITSGECIHELSSNGNKFHSCVFHPSFSTLLVIGGYQVILYHYYVYIPSSVLQWEYKY